MRKRTRATAYEKVSATLEAPVLRRIRERTANVSGFLNDAAKRKLYFDRLRAFDEELDRQGIQTDERFYGNLKRWLHEVDARQTERSRRATRATRSR